MSNPDELKKSMASVFIGRTIVKFRYMKRLTKQELSKKCKVPVEIIDLYERGRGDPCNRDYLDSLSRELEVVF